MAFGCYWCYPCKTPLREFRLTVLLCLCPYQAVFAFQYGRPGSVCTPCWRRRRGATTSCWRLPTTQWMSSSATSGPPLGLLPGGAQGHRPGAQIRCRAHPRDAASCRAKVFFRTARPRCKLVSSF